MYVVTGVTGNVGREVVTALLERGAEVRAVARDPATADVPEGAELVAGDLGDPAGLAEAFAGADGAFLLPGYPGLASAAAAAGISRIVQLSGGSAGLDDPANAVSAYMRESERELLATDVEWTILRPTAFMSNLLRWSDQLAAGDVVRVPFADVPLALVHPADIAAVAATSLAENGHAAMIYRPTGPEALLPEQQVAVLAEALGRPLRFEAQSNADARREMLGSMPARYVAAFYDFAVNGSIDETTVRPTVEDVTGNRPRTLQDWTRANAGRF